MPQRYPLQHITLPFGLASITSDPHRLIKEITSEAKKMFASQCISALVIVILCSSHSYLSKQDIDPNSSTLEASRIENGPSAAAHNIASLEKLDHNFYSSIGGGGGKKNKSALYSTKDAGTKLFVVSEKKKLTKKSATCPSRIEMFKYPNRKCTFVPSLSISKENLTTKTVPKLNSSENCDNVPLILQPTQLNQTTPIKEDMEEKGILTFAF